MVSLHLSGYDVVFLRGMGKEKGFSAQNANRLYRNILGNDEVKAMWKIVRRLVLAAFLMSAWSVSSVQAAAMDEKDASAAEMEADAASVGTETESTKKETSDAGEAIAKAAPAGRAQTPKAGKGNPAKKTTKQKAPKVRYEQILSDDNFTYYLDTESMRYIPMPHSGTEKILDVWIRLVDADKAGAAGKTYSYPQKYYLEHYYMRPEKRQVQFLCELEVTGRPENTIQQRSYSAQNWEDLVPGSIEDDLYHAVMGHIKKDKKGMKALQGLFPAGMSVRDALEEYLRISL